MAFKPSDAEWANFLAYVKSLPNEWMEKQNRDHQEESERLYREFKESFPKGECDCCGKSLLTFSKKDVCFHWLLRPKGAKKEDLETLLKAKGYFRAAAYVRWVANEEAFLSRINDLAEDGDEAVFHWSAVYKHIKWTFLCKKNDLQGHPNSQAAFPHYHIEIRLDGKVFVKFNDFHIPFSGEDLFNLKCNSDEHSPIKQSFGSYGAGIKDAFSIPPEKMLSETVSTDDESQAVYHIQSIITNEAGVPMEEIAEMIRKSKETGKPVAHFLRESGMNAQILISPTDSLPDKEKRSPRKK